MAASAKEIFSEKTPKVLEQHADAQMKAAISEEGGSGFAIKRALVRSISAAGAILDYTAEQDIDLVAMGTMTAPMMAVMWAGDLVSS